MGKENSMGVSAARSALLGSSGQIVKLTINMVSLVVLSRVLSAEDYGLTALAMALIGVAELVRDMGLSTASIRAKSLSRDEQNNLWWANTLLGAGCTIAVSLLAPFVAVIYDEPRLTIIIILMSLVFTLSGMTTQYRVDLIRKFHYGRIAGWEVVSGVLALSTALAIGFSGGGYWALVAQQVVNNFLVLIGAGFLAGWLPRKYKRAVSIKHFFKFALPLFGSSVLTYLAGNLDTVLIGKYFGNITLGSYNRALQMVRMPMNQLRNPLGNVALTVLGRADGEEEQYKNLVLKAQALFLYPIAFLAIWIALLAPDFIYILLGEKWSSSVDIVRVVALGEATSSLSTAAGWVYLSRDKSGALFRLTIYSTLLRIGLLIVAIPFGFNAVVTVFLLVAFILWPSTFIHCQRTTGFRTWPMFLLTLRVVTSIGFAATCGYVFALFVPLTNHFLSLSIGSIIFVASFLVFAFSVKPVKNDLDYVLATGKRLVKR